LGVFIQQYFFISSHQQFLDCGITAEGMKSISRFLSQDGFTLEELDFGNNALDGCFLFSF